MNYEEIMMLVRAGYTKDEISAMQAPAETAPADPAPADQAPADPAPTDQAPADPAQAPAGNPDAGSIAELTKAFNNMTAALQLQNINRDMMAPQPQRTAADAIAEIIMPPVRKK